LAAYNAVNRPPVAGNAAVSAQGDSASALTLSGADPEGSALTFQIVQLPTNGLISAFSPTIGALNYTPRMPLAAAIPSFSMSLMHVHEQQCVLANHRGSPFRFRPRWYS